MTSGDNGGFGDEMEKLSERALVSLEDNLKAKLPNAPESLKNDDGRLKFQLKMHELKDSMYRKLKCGNEKKCMPKQNDRVLHDARC